MIRFFFTLLLLVIHSLYSSPFIYNSVNVITGDYCERTADRVFNGTSWEFNENSQDIDYSFNDQSHLLKVRDSTGHEIIYTYAPHPNKTDTFLITSRNDIHYTYYSNGKVKKQIDPTQPTLSFYYFNDYTDVISSDNTKKRYFFNKYKVLTAIEEYNADQTLYRRENFVWNAFNQLDSHSIEDGTRTVRKKKTFRYDLFGNVLEEILYGNLTNEETYSTVYRYAENGTNQLLYERSSNGMIIRYEYTDESTTKLLYNRDQLIEKTIHMYDCDHNLVKTIIEGNTHSQITYYTPMQLIETFILNLETGEEKLSSQTTLTYSQTGQLICKKTDGVLYEYDQKGNLIHQSDQSGNNSLFSYDAKDRLVYEHHNRQNGSRSAFSYSYDSKGRKSRMQNIFGYETHYTYDTYNRLIETKTATCRRRQSYDILNNCTHITDGNGYTTTIQYNVHGEPISIIRPDGNLEDPKNSKQLKTAGYQQQEKLLFYNYDFYNEKGEHVLQTTEWNSHGVGTIITYDQALRPHRIETQNSFGQIMTYKELLYDAEGNKIQECFNDTYTVSWVYGPCKRIEQITENNKSTFYCYNQSGKVINIIKPDGVILSYTYTDSNKIAELISSDHTVHYQYFYDENDRIQNIFDLVNDQVAIRRWGDQDTLIYERLGNGLEVYNTFDKERRRTSMYLHNNTSVFYTYDDTRLRTVQRYDENRNILYTHEYHASGSSMHLPGGLGEVTYTLNEKKQLEKITSPFWNEELKYLNTGEVYVIKTEDPDGSKETFCEYDPLSRLTCENDQTFSYDFLSRRSDKIEYDLNSNRLNKGDIKFTYDALNRLTNARLPREWDVCYTYDAFGRRLSKILHTWDNETLRWKKSEHIYFLYDGNCEIGTTDQTLHVLEFRVLGTGLGAELGATVAIEIEGQTFIPIHDHRGSIACLINLKDKKPSAWYRYRAFGEVDILGNAPNPWMFCGKRHDPHTGLISFGQRDYDPEKGSWITQDPYGTPDGMNRHIFARNHPHQNIDPYGFFSLTDMWNIFMGRAKETFSFIEGFMYFCKQYISFTDYIRPTFEMVATELFGKSTLYLAGFYDGESETGIHGKGELSGKLRVTLINGILNARIDYKTSLDLISKSHGGINIHYIFDATDGWTWDLVKAFSVKIGFISPQAEQLAATWRELIDEMGGTESGGIIIHYAHSIGGAHTKAALSLLTPEEKKMLCVYTFGSPSTIYNNGENRVTNFISVRDGVCLFDPLGYISALFDLNGDIKAVGSWLGIPLIDHTIIGGTYMDIIERLGNQFLEDFIYSKIE